MKHNLYIKKMICSIIVVGMQLAAAENELQPGGMPSMAQRFQSAQMNDPESYVVVEEKAMNLYDPSAIEVGQAPSAEQLANLKEDMVWIKKEKIAGFEIYVPEVYLAEEK